MDFDSNLTIQKRLVKRRKYKFKRTVGIFTLLLIILSIETFLCFNGETMGDLTNRSVISTMTGTSTNKIVTVSKKIDTSSLKSQLSKYIKGFKGKYGIYYINLADGASFGINDDDQYIAASTVKIPINLYLFRKIEAGTINSQNTMTYISKDYEPGTGILQYRKQGTKYKIQELSRLSIEYSDNVATNMLIRLLGMSNYKNFMKQLGGSIVVDRNISCPKDMAIYIKRVYEFSHSNKVLGGQLIKYLENTEFNDRLPKYLPKSVKVAHKIGNYWGGEWGSALHDIGIIYTKNPYILAVMSRNVNEAEAYNVIASISKKVYDFQIKQK